MKFSSQTLCIPYLCFHAKDKVKEMEMTLMLLKSNNNFRFVQLLSIAGILQHWDNGKVLPFYYKWSCGKGVKTVVLPQLMLPGKSSV